MILSPAVYWTQLHASASSPLVRVWGVGWVGGGGILTVGRVPRFDYEALFFVNGSLVFSSLFAAYTLLRRCGNNSAACETKERLNREGGGSGMRIFWCIADKEEKSNLIMTTETKAAERPASIFVLG